jgi:hypothetical protein
VTLIDFTVNEPEATPENIERIRTRLVKHWRLDDQPEAEIADGRIRGWILSKRDWSKVMK